MSCDTSEFEKICFRTKFLMDIGYSTDIRVCANKALELEIDNNKLSRLGNEFGITKSELLSEVTDFVNNQLPGQMRMF